MIHDLYYDSWLNHVFAKAIHYLCKKYIYKHISENSLKNTFSIPKSDSLKTVLQTFIYDWICNFCLTKINFYVGNILEKSSIILQYFVNFLPTFEPYSAECRVQSREWSA